MNDRTADSSQLDAAAIIAVLNDYGVRFVVIGAFAAIAQQAPIPATRDIHITPETTAENLARLSAALTTLGARIRIAGDPLGLAFDHDATSLADAEMWKLVCVHGEFDISFRPSGFDEGYPQLALHARRMEVQGVQVEIASLDDVITSKEAAGRPKDLRILPALYRHRASRRRDLPAGSAD
ncbi:MAG: hypothetical protein JF887_05195 [Candidatus Dormibacteraeota bacterium]|uniref:Uncharacterized protein n=1 Tax=Candidatus Amunia macphersoniae TaxID=3127014 RepID=A0A934NFM9_9BACT|nr:hypothetical protein [Candidatus Dormibacteraeota bacterium]